MAEALYRFGDTPSAAIPVTLGICCSREATRITQDNTCEMQSTDWVDFKAGIALAFVGQSVAINRKHIPRLKAAWLPH